ncbi:MAG: hypothetical protein RMH75_07105, partial [Archaeoglobaceae archaeon]|nr:hypothetical protein [Archaeoglobaceae archaeon]
MRLYKEEREAFKKWLEKRLKTEKTKKDYINALDRYLFEGIKEPKDLDPIAYKSQSLNSAIRNFFNY